MTYPCTFMALGGPKYGYLGGKNRAVVAGLLWGEDQAWKPIYVPYHISLHGLTCIRVIFDLYRYLYGAGGVQNMAIWGVKTGLLWHASYGVGCFIWKVFSVPYHILIHDKRLLGAIHVLSSHCHGAGGSKTWLFGG